MKVTLIITVHNRLPMLRDILLSVANQSKRVDRIIIADDGSEEDVASTIKENLATVGVLVTHVRQPHEGFRAARSRNNAIREAEEGLLIFADQDLLFTRNYVETFIEHQQQGSFLVGYPLRLDQQQTEQLSDEMVASYDYSSIVRPEQLQVIAKQYRKDRLYQWLHRWHLRRIGPKLRSGVFGAIKSDLEKVNGFDENYQGWGNEDDDLGWRLHAAGICGSNVFNTEYALHQYHAPFHVTGVKINKDYFEMRKQDARKGKYRCDKGLELKERHHDDVAVVNYRP